MEVTKITFNGKIYNRYPDSKNRSDRVYFKCSGKNIYHRDLWEYHNGPIPRGHEIHHADFNSLNNDLSNLVCITEKEHHRLHVEHNKENNNWPYNKESLEHLEKIRDKASEWHKSPEGRKWHSEHAKQVAKKMRYVKMICEVCGDVYGTKLNMRKKSKFCSNKCRAKYRRDNRLDDTEHTCEACNTVFMANKYYKQRFCSISCAQKTRSMRR